MRCPLPLLKLKQALAQVDLGVSLLIKVTDAGALRDIPAYLGLTKHTLIEQSQHNDDYWFVVEKGE